MLMYQTVLPLLPLVVVGVALILGALTLLLGLGQWMRKRIKWK